MPDTQTPLPRPRAARVPRTVRRAQLMAAAHEVFVEHGYHGASMDEIAEMAQVSKPVVYQHFTGKHDLYLALLDHHLKTLNQLLEQALASTTVNEERVRAAVSAYFRFMGSEHRAYRLIFESDVNSDPEISARLNASNDRFASAIADIVMVDARLPRQEAELLGRGLAGAAQVCARSWVREEPEKRMPLTTAMNLVTDLAWRGISCFRADPL